MNQVSRPVNLSACSNQVLPSGTAVTLMLCLPLKIPGRPVRPTQLKSQLGLQRRELRSKTYRPASGRLHPQDSRLPTRGSPSSSVMNGFHPETWASPCDHR